MTKRKKLSRTERYAAVILDLKRGTGEPFVSREDAKHMTALEIIERFESMTQDAHIVPHAIGGSAHPSNMTIMDTPQHRDETRKIDIPQIAKTKRVEKDYAEHRRIMLAKTGTEETFPPKKQKRKIPSRPFPKRGQVMTR